MVKKQQGLAKSALSQISVRMKEEDECKKNYSDTKLLFVVESMAGFEGSKGKGKHEIKYPLEAVFKISLGEEVLGMSETYQIPSSEKFDINYSLVYTLPENPSQVLVSQPLTFTVLNAGIKEKRKSSSRGTRTSTTKQSSKTSPSSSSDNQLFETTIDLLPLVFGEFEIEQKVGDAIEVLVRIEGAKLKVPKNLLYVTVKNLHNPPSELTTSDVMAVTASINCLKSTETNPESPKSEWYKMKFAPGLITSTEAEVEEPVKRWFSVESGPPVLSQYRNLPNKELIRDPQRLSEDSNKSMVYIAWNQIKRIFLDSHQQEKLIHNLVENSEWSMDIAVKYGKKPDEKKKGKSNPIKMSENVNSEVVLYKVKLDMAELLHPGVNCCKIVGQLEPIQKVSLESPRSVTPVANSPLSALSQISYISQSNQKAMSSSTVAYRDDEVSSHRNKANKTQDFYGRASYITVFVELYSSFIPRKTTDQLLLSLKNFVREGAEDCPESDVNSPFQAQANFKTCLLDNIKYLNDIYLDFCKHKDDHSNDEGSVMEQSSSLEMELERSGALDFVKRSFSEAVTSLLKDTSCDIQSGLCEAYCKIVEETQSVLEEASKIEVAGPQIRSTSDELLFAAREASEENEYKQATAFLLKRIHYYGKRDADYWRDLAVLCLRHNDYPKAKQALFVALCIQPRHRDSLLMLAVLLSTEAKYSDASLIFEALTTFYPRFYKGWFTYCCFYNYIENKQGADVCLSLGSVCLNDRERDDGKVLPTYWSLEFLNPDTDGFLLTTAHLLSLNLIEFAEMCLSHHRLEAEEDTVPYLYFLSVAHHLQGKFKESNSHLKQALSISWNDEKLWNLMGHNLYRLGDFEKAIDCYKFFIEDPEPVEMYSLTYYRMGKISLQNFEYEQAIDYYLKAVSLSPSLKSWIGLAKSSYWAGKIEDAELAAREANRLDDRSSEPWACLALVNLQNCPHPQLARHCLSLAAQCGEIDNELLQEINQILDSYQEIPVDFTKTTCDVSIHTAS